MTATDVTAADFRQLESTFVNQPVDWIIPLGDNWLSVWAWARALERDRGIDHQSAITMAQDRYPFGSDAPYFAAEWE